MKLPEQFISAVERHRLFNSNDKLLIAVSGGVDSVVLCELCKLAGYDFEIAHCNFQLRGEESERDEKFVQALGEKYGVVVTVKKFDTESYAKGSKISIQEAARELRYAWFLQRINWLEHELEKKTYLVTAHHADDNGETLLMNFLRGTGLHGLTGMPMSASIIRRPLLGFSKEELIAFAKSNDLEFVEDSSNDSSKYTRNYFRNEIIPAICKVYPQVKDNLQDNIVRFKEIEKLYRFSVGAIIKKISKAKGNELHIPVRQLMGFNSRALIYEVISAYDFNEKQVDELIKLSTSESGRFIESPWKTYRIIKHRHWFIISPLETLQSENIIIEQGIKHVEFAMGLLSIETLPNPTLQIPNSNNSACLDLKYISFPLLLRKWKQADYFYPLGMKKKKKVARFFIDQKMPRTDKEKTWVLESDNRIVWVLGHRIDERFKITPATKDIIRLELTPAK